MDGQSDTFKVVVLGEGTYAELELLIQTIITY